MSNIKRSISMYSLQDEYLNKRMSFEDIFKFLKEQGVGIELLSDQMIKGAPFPNEETLKEWDNLVKKYDMALVCNDIFINTKLYNNRNLTTKEATKLLIDEIKLANRLGFKLVRLVSNTPTEIIKPALPYCEKYDVTLGLEIHAGMSFGTSFTDAFTDIMFETQSKYLGIVVDAGIFCRRLPRVYNNYFKSLGANPKLIEKLDSIVDEKHDIKGYLHAHNIEDNSQCTDEIKSLIQSGIDFEYWILSSGYECTPFEILDKYMPYVKHIHGKIYEITEDGVEYSIPYDEFINYLHKHNYNGYISTEYEGNRFTLEGKPMKEKEQTILHQKLLKKIIENLN